MIAKFLEWLSPPVFADNEEKNRQARVLNALQINLALTLIIGGGAGILFFFSEKKITSIVLIISMVIILINFYLTQKGHLNFASLLTLTALWFTTAYLVFVSSGTRSLDIMFFVSGTVVAGILLGPRGASIYAILSLLISLTFAIMTNSGFVFPQHFPFPSFSGFILLTLSLGFVIIPLNITLTSLSEALATAQQEIQERKRGEEEREKLFAELEHKTQDLQTLQASLELANQTLDKNETFLRAIINNIPFDLWVCDAGGRYTIQNAISFNLAGDLTGKTVDELDFAPPERLAEYKAKHQRVLNGETIREEIQETIKGEERSMLSVQTPVRDGREFLGFVGMNIDLTEIQQAKKSLQESEALYQSLVEVLPMSVCRKDLEGRFIFVNKRFCDGFRLPESEILGKTDFDLHPMELAKKYRKDDLAVIASEHMVEMVEEHRPIDGDRSYVQVFKSPIFDARGRANGIQIVFWDISKRVLAEKERNKLIDELEVKNEELERFTYTVSHDLKAPLITISGFLSYLEEDALKGDVMQLKKDIQRITGASSKMQRLLDELLELSRIGRMVNLPETISFEEIVREALENVKGRLGEGKIEVKVGSDLPVVHGDRIRLVEVIQNLVDNAAKFMGNQSKPLIEIGVRKQGGKDVFFVKDNGIGIEPQYHDKIFELFDKLDPNSDGTGIGLALVKRIVNVHNGKIWVESQGKGTGATFYFTLSQKPNANKQEASNDG